MEKIRIQNFINGEFSAPVSGNYLDNIDPATGEVYSFIPDSDERDVELAVAAARAAFPSWSMMQKENVRQFYQIIRIDRSQSRRICNCRID